MKSGRDDYFLVPKSQPQPQESVAYKKIMKHSPVKGKKYIYKTDPKEMEVHELPDRY